MKLLPIASLMLIAAPVSAQGQGVTEPDRRITAEATATVQSSPRPDTLPQRRPNTTFLERSSGDAGEGESRRPSGEVKAYAMAVLFEAIKRQLRPHWQPPSGADAERIVTRVRFRLERDGRLAAEPEILDQRGVDATNRGHSDYHAEQAVRAVQLAAPFDLPEQYYEAWKLITVDFDWKLAQ